MKKPTILDFDTSLNQTLSRTTRLAPRVLLGLLMVSSIALLISAFSFEQRLSETSFAMSDNNGWNVAQLEVDQQDLMLSLANALSHSDMEHREGLISEVELAEIKQEFDVFYSRVDLFEHRLKHLLSSGALMEMFRELKVARQEMADQIDSISSPDIQALLIFQEMVVKCYPKVRTITITALQESERQAHQARRHEYSVFKIFLVQSIVLVALMALSAFLAMRIWRELEEKTVEKFRIGGLLSRAFNSTLNAVLVTDRNARILYSNPMAQQIFGMQSASLVGSKINNVISLEDSKVPNAGGRFGPFASLIDAGPKIVGSRNSDGNPIFIEMLLVRDKDLAGREVVICFIRDITDQVVAEEGLKDALRVAERASSAKSAFLATMSHEMRTPLHGIMASLELIKDSDLDAVNLNLLETAEACSHRALTQINNVLEMARLGQQYEAPSDLRPDLIAQNIVRELKPLADTSRNTLELMLQGPFAAYRFEGLPYTFSQVLYNLVDNAIKFTENGSVMVRLFLSEAHSGTATLFVEVADTGIGISEDAQAYIFEEFKTADPNNISPKSGTGLGLSIAKRGVDMQGGELLLCSFPGEGSRFHFKIPLNAVPVGAGADPVLPVASALPEDRDSDAKKILIVDDSEVNLSLMREMMHRMGHEVDLAENGEVAVAKASTTHYDAILMDFSMPVMDGPTAAGKIRAMRTAPGQVVIIGVTALIDANADPRNQGLFDAILIKPVGQAQLARAIEECVARQTPSLPSSEPAEAAEAAAASFVPSDSTMDAEDALADTGFDEVISLVGKDTAIRLLKTGFSDVDHALAAMSDASMTVEDKAGPIHKSVGSTALLGLEDLSEALSEAEMMALSGTDPMTSELPKLIAALLKEAQFDFAPLIAAHDMSEKSLAGSDA